MALATVEFPRSLLRENSSRLELARRTVSPGIGGTGVLPVIATDGGGLWELDYGAVNLRTKDHVRTWEAMAALSDGGATPFIVPYCGSFTAPFGSSGGTPYGQIPFDDDMLFADGVGFHQPAIGAHTPVGGAYPLRATTIEIAFDLGGGLRGGEHFSIFHPTAGWRLYRIVQIMTEYVPGTYYQVKIRPPLREAVGAEVAIDFENLCCTMQLAEPRAMDLTRQMRKGGSPSAMFIESFP